MIPLRARAHCDIMGAAHKRKEYYAMRTDYINYLAEIGVSQAEADARLAACFDTLFFDESNRIWHDVDADSACIVDTGNIDARTEGMSYGMMMCVQMNRQDLFDKLWRFSTRFMLQTSGKYEGYFAWSVGLDGKHNADGPAPDGEEYFAMALFMAAARWNDDRYAESAREILRHCVHQHELVNGGLPMWEPSNHYIKFVPEADFSDPSYHLPHFYELFAHCADERDRDFWREAAQASRRYIALCAHSETGLCAEYAEYDTRTKLLFNKDFAFYSDAYRVLLNIGLDTAWGGGSAELADVATHAQNWLFDHPELLDFACDLDGKPHTEPTMHPLGLLATMAAGSPASQSTSRPEWLRRFWESPMREGKRRYYDNCLYFFTLLLLSGNYRIYTNPRLNP